MHHFTCSYMQLKRGLLSYAAGFLTLCYNGYSQKFPFLGLGNSVVQCETVDFTPVKWRMDCPLCNYVVGFQLLVMTFSHRFFASWLRAGYLEVWTSVCLFIEQVKSFANRAWWM